MTAQIKRLPTLLTVVTTVAMIIVTGWQGYRFWQTQDQWQPSNRVAPVQASDNATEQPRVELATLDFFGKPGETGTLAQEETENLPETNLRLTLRGVMAAEADLPGSALIEDDSNNTEVYLVGDELPGDARLRSVHPNRVIIQRGGKLENLYFPEPRDRSGLNVSATEASPPANGNGQTTTAPEQNPGVQPDATEQRREEIRRRLEQLRERLRNSN